MRERFREQLQKEMTRGQFLQIMAGLLLSIFGFNNLLSFFSPSQSSECHPLSPGIDQDFGTRRFGR